MPRQSFGRWLGRMAARLSDEPDAAPPDLMAFQRQLARAAGIANYTPRDRHRDFRAVFMASVQGRRVLYQILEWSHMWGHLVVPGDASATHVQLGERNVGLRLVATLNAARPASRTGPRPKIPATKTERSHDHG